MGEIDSWMSAFNAAPISASDSSRSVHAAAAEKIDGS
jgi:hypothetical protein